MDVEGLWVEETRGGRDGSWEPSWRLDPRCDLWWSGAGDKAGGGDEGSGFGYMWESTPSASAEGGSGV